MPDAIESDLEIKRVLEIGRLVTEAKRTGTPLTITVNGANCPIAIAVRGTTHISVSDAGNGPDKVIEAAKNELQNGGGTNHPLTRIVK